MKQPSQMPGDIAPQPPNSRREPLLISEQGSFAVGGSVVRRDGVYDPTRASPEGQSLHGDHAFVTYQVPVEARKLPITLLHGNSQFSKTWQTTPDGREGFQNILLRQRFACYLIDQPRRGNAGRSTLAHTIPAIPDDQTWFDAFRIGVWPRYYDGVQFPRDPEALEQFFRQITPDTGPFDADVVADSVGALFARIGDGILVTHSKGGGIGWMTALRSDHVRGIVSYEPGTNFIFPEGEVPAPISGSAGVLHAVGVPLAQFERLTRIPIALFYGDFIPDQPSPIRGQDQWRTRLEMARLWADAVNRHGGDVTLVRLPDLGIRGNTHFPFSDLNNVEVADQLLAFLARKGLA